MYVNMVRIDDYNSITIKEMKSIYKTLRIKGYSRLNKLEMYNKLNKMNTCAQFIQNAYRIYKRWIIDPLTLEPITSIGNMFVYKSNSGVHQKYEILNLVEYIIQSGDFRDPLSREIYTDDIIEYLDRRMIEMKQMKPSLFLIKESKLFEKNIERHNLLCGLENQFGNYINMIYTMLSNMKEIETHCTSMHLIMMTDFYENQYFLKLTTHQWEMIDYINQMKYIDINFAKNVLYDSIMSISHIRTYSKIKDVVLSLLQHEYDKI